ncbi:Hypoxic response protein 1 [Planctomycetes bacterium Poly30]|uniref:Hypoxic response protein 1 n=1 Tax=Saltatorellus ferox TaxID=2528018 RepID=A0A518F0T6_9BACT|nr:Hypoxic response protein 1 [Planctomycetes bacterium Poly30]
MKVQEFMTASPVTIDEDASLETALRTMDEHAIRHLPVVDGEHLIGVVSNRDLLGVAGWRGVERDADAVPRWVRDVMHRDVITVNPGDDALAAATEVFARHIGCVPVIEDGKLLGIISEMDLVGLIAERDRVNSSMDATIGSLGAPRAFVVAPDATLAQIDELMSAKDIRHVPVADGDKLLGMVSDRDMRRADADKNDWSIEARDFMTEGVVTVHEDLPISQAAAVMSDRRIGALVVTSESGDLGIVTTSDLLGYLLDAL